MRNISERTSIAFLKLFIPSPSLSSLISVDETQRSLTTNDPSSVCDIAVERSGASLKRNEDGPVEEEEEEEEEG